MNGKATIEAARYSPIDNEIAKVGGLRNRALRLKHDAEAASLLAQKSELEAARARMSGEVAS